MIERELEILFDGTEALRGIEDDILFEKQFTLTKHRMRDFLITVAEKGIEGNIEDLKYILYLLKEEKF